MEEDTLVVTHTPCPFCRLPSIMWLLCALPSHDVVLQICHKLCDDGTNTHFATQYAEEVRYVSALLGVSLSFCCYHTAVCFPSNYNRCFSGKFSVLCIYDADIRWTRLKCEVSRLERNCRTSFVLSCREYALYNSLGRLTWVGWIYIFDGPSSLGRFTVRTLQ